ncbi:MAG: hypothetical protein A6F71_08380 [Cycloclasticus sp. symbiont of Poecilosclerida sp. M]|nr:MAG: hypothetical protein A6F71_08380 [Cycloclasticus sp. symbiont of Poecilosclerida sp. M]
MKKQLVCIFLLTHLSGCASLETFNRGETNYSVGENTSLLARDTNWSLSGRLAINASKRAWLTKLDWQHTLGSELIGSSDQKLSADSLVLSTSLGGIAAKILYTGGVLYLVDEHGLSRPSQLGEIREMLGFKPPLEHLQYWVRGKVSPSLSVASDTKEDGLENSERTFQQENWVITLERYQLAGDVWLPKKITARGHDVVIKLVVDRWS